VLALPRAAALTSERFTHLAHQLGVARRFPFDPARLHFGFVHASRGFAEGLVLRDAGTAARN